MALCGLLCGCQSAGDTGDRCLWVTEDWSLGTGVSAISSHSPGARADFKGRSRKKETINRAFVLIYAVWHACPTPTREEGPSLWAAGSWRPMA